jgi:hypothetical protein
MTNIEIKKRLEEKHGFNQVDLKVMSGKVDMFAEVGYTFTGVREGKAFEGTILYAIEYGKYVVKTNSEAVGHWL